MKIPVHSEIELWLTQHKNKKEYHTERRKSQEIKERRYQSKSKKFSPTKTNSNFSYKDSIEEQTKVFFI